jgi:hypothetical protein
VYPTTDRFLLFTNRSGRRSVVADIYYNGGLLRPNVPIVDGSVTFDRRNSIRAAGDLRVASDLIDWTILDPWGTEIQIKMGVIYPGGVTEYVPLGIFRIEDYRYTEGGAVAPHIRFFDRAKLLEEAQATDLDFSGMIASEAVAAILEFAIPSWDGTMHLNFEDYRLPGGTIASSSLLSFLEDIAAAQGAEIWFDRHGEFHMEIAPEISETTTIDDAVYDFSVGVNLISAERVLTRVGAYNAVYVVGTTDGTGAPVRGLAVDNSAGSLSNYGGPFGRRIQRLHISGITTPEGAQAAAEALLRKRIGLMKNTSFVSLLNPALDPADIVTLLYFDNTVEIHQINSMRFDLRSWSMSCGTSSIQVVE